jgi:hypothetical protein
MTFSRRCKRNVWDGDDSLKKDTNKSRLMIIKVIRGYLESGRQLTDD